MNVLKTMMVLGAATTTTADLGVIPIAYYAGILKRTIFNCNEYLSNQTEMANAQLINETLRPFFKKMGVREDIVVVESPSYLLMGACGTNYIPQGTLYLAFSSKICDVDRDACTFAMKHEVAHIIHDDPVRECLASLVCSLALGILFKTKKTKLSSKEKLILTCSICALVKIAFSQYNERQADNSAIAESSTEELLGGRRLILAAQQINANKTATAIHQAMNESSGLPFILKAPIELYLQATLMLYTTTGLDKEDCYDVWHPTLQSRVTKFEAILEERGVHLDDDAINAQNTRIQSLKLALSSIIHSSTT